MLSKIKNSIPLILRRRVRICLARLGLVRAKPTGTSGIQALGHRGYVGDSARFDEIGALQLGFLKSQGLRPEHVLYDIACGSLRAGRHIIPYLDAGNYMGMDGERTLIDLGLKHEIDAEACRLKCPEFVISFDFEFDRFTKPPDYALSVSLFSHLTEQDIRKCLQKLANRVLSQCTFFTTFYEGERPLPNFKKSHPHLEFYYTNDQMREMGQDYGWTAENIGEIPGYGVQKVMRYRLAK